MEQKEKTQPSAIPVEVAQEYPAKLLGFAPLQLSDDLYNVFITCLGQMIDKFGEKVMEKFESRFPTEKIQSLTYYLKEKLEYRLSDMFDTFEAFLVGKVLYLHPSVVLEDDEPQLTYSQKTEKFTDKRIEKYKNRIIVLKSCITKIEEETAQINSVLETIRNMKNNINQTVEKLCGSKSVDDLCRHVSERNQRIKQLISSLTSVEISTDSNLQRQKRRIKQNN